MPPRNAHYTPTASDAPDPASDPPTPSPAAADTPGAAPRDANGEPPPPAATLNGRDAQSQGEAHGGSNGDSNGDSPMSAEGSNGESTGTSHAASHAHTNGTNGAHTDDGTAPRTARPRPRSSSPAEAILANWGTLTPAEQAAWRALQGEEP
ncbi:hypothetical protein PsYK624_150810 [Phanerochaete sordida]|uniref:Uncharacterized protein n=1 Tax=Phanerochaete sordida TaxID=48140 RepID=A0A9P3LLM1_9APHY|nr:hypothetical protein PsYK624_150810 [Phanerochaete sordida]